VTPQPPNEKIQRSGPAVFGRSSRFGCVWQSARSSNRWLADIQHPVRAGRRPARLNKVAFANVAWCATKGNVYPAKVLERCFGRHTGPLLELLRSSVVLAAGHKAGAFAENVSNLSCSPNVILILHHAHRKGRVAAQRDFERVRAELKRVRREIGG
jgi:hypothetical protein